MMERIKELEAQCWSHRINGILVDGQRHFDTKKFAELIVRECVATMYKHGETYAHTSAGFYQARTFSEAIMEHFGVEE